MVMEQERVATEPQSPARAPPAVNSDFVMTDVFVRANKKEQGGLSQGSQPENEVAPPNPTRRAPSASPERIPPRVNHGFDLSQEEENPILTHAERRVSREEEIQAAFLTGAVLVGGGIGAYFLVKWLWKTGITEDLMEEVAKNA